MPMFPEATETSHANVSVTVAEEYADVPENQKKNSRNEVHFFALWIADASTFSKEVSNPGPSCPFCPFFRPYRPFSFAVPLNNTTILLLNNIK